MAVYPLAPPCVDADDVSRSGVEQPVATRLAARETGVPERTIRNWIKSGKLGAMQGERGYLVRVGDVRRVAAIAGRDPATGKLPETTRQGLAATRPEEQQGALVTREAEQRFIQAMQEAVQPLVEQIGDLSLELGRERALREAAEAEAERLRGEIAEERERARGSVSWWRRLFGGRDAEE